MNRWGMLVLGVGAGALAGSWIGGSATVPAVVAIAGGLILLAVGARSSGRDLVAESRGPATTSTTEVRGPATEGRGRRESLAGLGHRVDGILDLAEEQAADHIAEAKATAERIVAEARAEAARIRRE